MEEEWSVEACNSCGVHEGMNEGILRQEEGCWQEEGCFRHEGWIAQRCGYGRWGSVQGRGRGKRVATIAAFREKSRFRACPVSKWDRKTSPLDCFERRHSCSRLTLTLFFSLSDTQTTTPVCHYGPIPDGPPPKGRIERIGPVVTLICCCAYTGTATLGTKGL